MIRRLDRRAIARLLRTSTPRDRLLLGLMLGAGLRPVDLAGLRRKGFDARKSIFRGPDRTYLLNNSVVRTLSNYLDELQISADGPLFLGNQGRSLHPKSIARIIGTLGRRILGHALSPRDLREWFRQQYLYRTGDARALGLVLRGAPQDAVDPVALRVGLPALPLD